MSDPADLVSDNNPSHTVLEEIEETLTSINSVIKDYHYSLDIEKLEPYLDDLEKKELFDVYKKIHKVVPEDLEDMITLVDKLPGENKYIMKDILGGLIKDGVPPRKYIDAGIQHSLKDEIIRDDPELVQDLNKVEVATSILALRYRAQTILVEYLREKKNLPISLEVDDLEVPDEVEELEEELEQAENTSSIVDDYLAQYELAIRDKYQLEERMFIKSKLMQHRYDPGKLEDINPDKIDYVALNESYIGKYSFHIIKLFGSDFNFLYIADGAEKREFFELPKIDKPVILLLHGMNSDWTAWKHMIRLLSPHYDLIVPDMNGWGDSSELIKHHTFNNYADYVAKFIKKLEIQDKLKATIGFSMGSFTNQELLHNYGIKPEKAVLLSSAVGVGFKFLQGSTKLLMSAVSGGAVKNAMKLAAIIPSKMDKVAISKASPRAITEIARHAFYEYKFQSSKGVLDIPTLLVTGTKDMIVPPSQSLRLLDYFDNAEHIQIEGASHTQVMQRVVEDHGDYLLKWLEK